MKALFNRPPSRPPLAKHPLTRKLVIVTAIKLAGLLVIWWAFFSGHGAHDMTPEQAAEAVLHPQTGNKDIGNTSK